MIDDIDQYHILIFNEGLKFLNDDFQNKISDKNLTKIYQQGLHEYHNKLEKSFNKLSSSNSKNSDSEQDLSDKRVTSPFAISIIPLDEIKEWDDEKLKKANNDAFKITLNYKGDITMEETYKVARTNTNNIRNEIKFRKDYNDI